MEDWNILESLLFVIAAGGARRLRAQQRLDRAALVHGTIALRYLVEWQAQIKDLIGPMKKAAIRYETSGWLTHASPLRCLVS